MEGADTACGLLSITQTGRDSHSSAIGTMLSHHLLFVNPKKCFEIKISIMNFMVREICKIGPRLQTFMHEVDVENFIWVHPAFLVSE